ncbi:SAVED domain-containing protein [Fredinandcohnia onubensis]|uniref:SAVED domain-containing protein n=1 Tax=Fredinandcohnia onubensis TaxID=1571209 RepID=UPI000C0C0BD3|nr:SAVED domain-containing protein [Fredinandcohnia onubensis]
MSWNLLTIVILLAGVIFLFIKTKNRQIEFGFSVNFITTGLALITDSFGTTSAELFSFLRGEDLDTNYVQLGTGLVLIVIGIWMSRYVKNKLTILNLLGVKERRIEEHRADVGLNQFEFKEREIDLSNYAKKGMSQERYDDVTELIDIKMESFCAENKDVKKGYTGNAPIPLTMYAGYRYKGKPTTDFFEYDRFAQRYYKLQKAKRWYRKKKQYPKLSLQQPLDNINLAGAEEVVLGISVTMLIKREQVQQFNAPFVHLSIPEPVHNAIKYEEQLYEYIETIFHTIVELGNQHSFKRIHLVISSQSSLPFELGKQLTTESYMKKVINYHYVNGPIPRYTWGISFNSQGTNYLQC